MRVDYLNEAFFVQNSQNGADIRLLHAKMLGDLGNGSLTIGRQVDLCFPLAVPEDVLYGLEMSICICPERKRCCLLQ